MLLYSTTSTAALIILKISAYIAFVSCEATTKGRLTLTVEITDFPPIRY
jgi:hypothetical protein